MRFERDPILKVYLRPDFELLKNSSVKLSDVRWADVKKGIDCFNEEPKLLFVSPETFGVEK